MIISQTPLRLSLLGGNTDFPAYFIPNGGACLTTTIDKYVYCIVKERFDDQIWINYSIKEIVNSVNEIKHDLVREAMKMVGVTKGVEITFLSDIPGEGSGLGSSSAVTVGVLNALYQFKGESRSAKDLAIDACEIEIEILKKPIGCQDQFAVAYGGQKLLLFGVNQPEVAPVSMSYLPQWLMLFYTGITRKSESVLSQMKLDTEILNRNKQLAIRFASDFDVNGFGSALDEYWQLKKKLNPAVSNEVIDTYYDQARLAGALGGKIVGAGGGGFLLLVVPPENKQAVRDALELKELPFDFSNTGSKIIFNIQK